VVDKGSRDLLFEILGLPHISRTAEARNLKFGMQIDYCGN